MFERHEPTAVICLPEVRARSLLLLGTVSVLGAAIIVSSLWPGWSNAEEPSVAGGVFDVLVYLFVVGFLYASCSKYAEQGFPIGYLPPLSEALLLASLAVPLVGISYLGLIGLYFPLSYAFPEFVGAWVLDHPPLILWRPGIDAMATNALTVFSVVLLAPVVEEAVFRGFLLNRWMSKYGTFKGIAFSSAAFALLHVDIMGGAVFAVVLSLIYVKTRSLFGPIIVHIANNTLVVAVTLIESAVTGRGPLTIQEFRDIWWTGPIGGLVGIPWLAWFLRTKLDELSS